MYKCNIVVRIIDRCHRLDEREEAFWSSRVNGGNVKAPEPTQFCAWEEDWEEDIAANSDGAYSPRLRSTPGITSGRFVYIEEILELCDNDTRFYRVFANLGRVT